MGVKRAKEAKMAVKPVDIFSEIQEAPLYQHEKYLKELKQVLQESENEDLFCEEFKLPLLAVLHSPFSVSFTKKTLVFTANFLATKFKEEDDQGCDELGPFLSNICNFVLELGKLDDKNLRLNVCSLLNQLFGKLAQQEVALDDSLCDKTIHLMISERICDKVPGVREAAAKVLQWLQDETNAQCNVTRTLMFHMDRDPSSEVRSTILKVIRVSATTLPSIVRRTRDTKVSIRVDAYKVLAERRKMTSLSYSTREKVILSGLKDESALVRSTVEGHLLTRWLEQLDGGLLQFVRELDADTHPQVPTLALPHLFKTKPLPELLEPLLPAEGEKFVSLEVLDSSLALYWSCLAKYLTEDEERKGDAAETLERLIPSISELCTYIEMFFNTSLPAELTGDKLLSAKVRRISTMVYLLGLFDSADLSDEMGRKNLSKMLKHIMLSSEANSRLLVAAMKQLKLAFPDPCARTDEVLAIIEELHRPMQQVNQQVSNKSNMSEVEMRRHQVAVAKVRVAVCNLQAAQEKAIDNQDFLLAEQLKEEIKQKRTEIGEMEEAFNAPPDAELERVTTWETPILIKCLTILTELMRSTDAFKASIGLVDIIDSFVSKCVAPTMDPHVVAMGVEVYGMYCLQRLTNAKQHFPLFYIMLNTMESDEVRAVCVKSICAIILHHGLANLGIPEEEPVFAPERPRLNQTRNELSYINNISFLMDDLVLSVRNEATIGLSKMLLSGRISSIPLLSRLLLLWFNPSTNSNKPLMKLLGQFFTYYPAFHYEAPGQLVAALLPTLDLLLNAPHTSPLLDIDVKEVGLFILDLTRPGKNRLYEANPHDEIARLLMLRILEETAGDSIGLFLRLCINLQLSLDDEETRLELLQLAKRIKSDHIVDQKNKDIGKLLLMLRSNDLASSDGSQRATMGSQTQSEAGTDLQSQADNDDMEINDDEDEEDEEEEGRLNLSRRASKRSSATLGHVSESSDSETSR